VPLNIFAIRERERETETMNSNDYLGNHLFNSPLLEYICTSIYKTKFSKIDNKYFMRDSS